MKKPRTEAQKEASRRNGRKSKGPITPEGKLRSCLNAITHGITRTSVMLDKESKVLFDTVHAALVRRFQPQDAAEELAVECMFVNEWRVRRCWEAEQFRITEIGLVAAMASDSMMDTISRYEERYDRRITRALARLHAMRDRSGFRPDPLPGDAPSLFEQLKQAATAAEAASAAPEMQPSETAPSETPAVALSFTGRVRTQIRKIEPALTMAASASTLHCAESSPCLSTFKSLS